MGKLLRMMIKQFGVAKGLSKARKLGISASVIKKEIPKLTSMKVKPGSVKSPFYGGFPASFAKKQSLKMKTAYEKAMRPFQKGRKALDVRLENRNLQKKWNTVQQKIKDKRAQEGIVKAVDDPNSMLHFLPKTQRDALIKRAAQIKRQREMELTFKKNPEAFKIQEMMKVLLRQREQAKLISSLPKKTGRTVLPVVPAAPFLLEDE